MDGPDDNARWERLLRLLGPIHPQAVATARRLCRSDHDGDDLYQEAVLRAHGKLPGLRDESRFRSWFFAVLLSVHRSRARRPRRDAMGLEDIDEPVGEDGRVWDEERRRAERATRALASLEPEQREAIVLHELDGFSVAEVAGMQGVGISAVKSRLARGRERLRRFYLRITPDVEAPRSAARPAGAMAWPAKESTHER